MNRWTSLLVATLWSIVGCAGSDQATSEADPASENAALSLSEPVHHLDALAREPMFVEHPDGTLFVSGYGGSHDPTGNHLERVPNLWKSVDGGASWERVDVGTADEGAVGNSDVDLAVSPSGTLYFAIMGFDPTSRRGAHIAIGVSHDIGASWTWTMLSQDEYDDRPWVGVTPGGTAHVVWNDGGGVAHSISRDEGRTWTERERIHPQGGSSHLAVGPGGEVAVRISPLSASGYIYDDGVELIAVSTDDGETWAKYPPPGTQVWAREVADFSAIPRWVEPLAWDAAGTLFHLWAEGEQIWLGQSTDLGATWESWVVSQETDRAFCPYLVAGAPGELGASWFIGRDEALAVRVARLDVSRDDGAPTASLSEPFQMDVWREDPEGPIRNTGGEYVTLGFISDDRLAMVTPLQDPAGDRWGFSWWTVEGP